jgi:cytochrome c
MRASKELLQSLVDQEICVICHKAKVMPNSFRCEDCWVEGCIRLHGRSQAVNTAKFPDFQASKPKRNDLEDLLNRLRRRG